MKDELLGILQTILRQHGLEASERGKRLANDAAIMLDEVRQAVGQPGFEQMAAAIPTVLQWKATRAAIDEADAADKTTAAMLEKLLMFGVSVLRLV